jgi:solute:Na+ symporter, SSS family
MQFPRPHPFSRHWIRGLSLPLLIAPLTSLAAEKVDAPARGFSGLDWGVVIFYALALIGIGLFYSRRQTTTEEYFVGSRSVSPFLAGISLYATLFSTLSYIGVPGEIVQNGPVLVAVGVAATPLIYLFVGYLVIPLLMKLPVTSAYELLEKQLGFSVRLLGSAIFVISRLIWMAIMLYITAKVLVTVMGWPATWSTPLCIIAGLLTAVYTVTGGLRAVVVSDVVQFFVLLTGAIFTLVFITYHMGGPAAWWPTIWVDHWAPQPFFSMDPHVRVTVVGTFIGAIIWWVCTAGSDQMAIQRYLSTRDVKAARRAFLHNCAGSVVVTVILGLVGLAVLGFYRANPDLLPSSMSFSKKGDVFFPHFVSHFLPVGIPGLVLAGLLAAAMSSLSSGINSTITVIAKDFIDPFRRGAPRTEKSQIKTARYLAAAVSVTAILGSQVAGAIPGNLIEVTGKTLHLLLCPLFGLFFMALFVRFATPYGAIVGAVYSFMTGAVIGHWDLVIGGNPVSFQWITPTSLAAALIFGPLFSLIPTRKISRPRLAGYSIAAALPWVALIACFR